MNLADQVTKANRELLIAQGKEAISKYRFLAVIIADKISGGKDLGSSVTDFKYWRDRATALNDEYTEKYLGKGKSDEFTEKYLVKGKSNGAKC